MFTGLVEAMGQVSALAPEGGGGALLRLKVPPALAEAQLGDSIAINGACLTVIQVTGNELAFQLAPETLRRTNLGRLQPGAGVNLERALRVGDRLGGHWVQGHVDGQGTLLARQPDAGWETFRFRAPAELSRYMVAKGSIAVDGVSLTLAAVDQEEFTIALIPHTLAQTTFGTMQPGAAVNLEVDLLAKYVEKLLAGRLP